MVLQRAFCRHGEGGVRSDRDGKWLDILWFAYHKHQNKQVRKGLLFISSMAPQVLKSEGHTFSKTNKKRDSCELPCFDPYDKQIVRYLTLLLSL